ncbi:MAG: B12-binding domain-containing radical SAM protein [Proteobacteria bacterium]|nr:B12-binding domain-containing radical SAM protein [Pseudomonadota bacterium]
MNIVLVRPRYASHLITPPLGLGYLAAYLRQRGARVTILDGLLLGRDNRALAEAVEALCPDAVGITCQTAFWHEAADLARRLKARGQRVILGGVHPSFLPGQSLAETGADFVVRGEGERALFDLADSGFSGFLGKNIPGVVGAWNMADPDPAWAPLEEDLDALPFPAWDLMDPRAYPKAPHGAIVKNYPIGVVMTSRGCPYSCSFCASPRFWGGRVRLRSPENVLAEVRMLAEKFDVAEIHFEDDNFTLDRDRATEISRLMGESGLNLSWACPNGIRADRVDKDLIFAMKKAGCYYFAFGIESADPNILANIHKAETIETISRSIGLADDAGISCLGLFILGLPGETRETMEKTIRFAKNSRLSRAQFLILDVLPGSALWDELAGRFTPDWTKNSFKEPEWIPPGLTKKDLMDAQARAFRSFYLSRGRFLSLVRQVRLGQIPFLIHRLFDYRILPAPRKKRRARKTPGTT